VVESVYSAVRTDCLYNTDVSFRVNERSRGSSTDIVTRLFLLSKTSRHAVAYNRALYSMGTGDLASGVKQPGRKADCSHPYTAKVNQTYSDTSTAPKVFKFGT
jgi:hypothetical protein